MEIRTNNTQTTTAYSATKQTEDSSTDRSFDNYINTNTQEDTQKANSSSKEDYIEVSETTQQTQTLTYTQDVAKIQDEAYDPDKKYLNTLDKYMPNYFTDNDISTEDEETIRNVLADNQISESEARNLSFEQTKHLQNLKFDLMDYGTQNDVPVMWMSGENSYVQSIMAMTNYSQDDTLNRAIHKTFTENYTSDTYKDKHILAELTSTLKQAYEGMDIGLNLFSASSPFGLLHEFENSEMDYDSHILKVLNEVDTKLNTVKIPDIRESLEDLNKGFGLILDNYRELKNENNKEN